MLDDGLWIGVESGLSVGMEMEEIRGLQTGSVKWEVLMDVHWVMGVSQMCISWKCVVYLVACRN